MIHKYKPMKEKDLNTAIQKIMDMAFQFQFTGTTMTSVMTMDMMYEIGKAVLGNDSQV